MKKHYFLFIAVALITTTVINAQNLIQGGNMEDASAWTTNSLNGEQGATIEFNYTDNTPADGEGGSMRASATNTGINYTQTVIYQEVTLARGTSYAFDGAFKDMTGMTGNWIEVFVSGVEIPEEGTSDYGPGDDLIYVIKPSTDDNGCDSENGDDLFSNIACDGPGTAMFEGEGDTTVYVALKFGTWGDGNAFDLLFDELSLTVTETSSTQNTLSEYKVFPTKMANELSIELKSNIKDVQVINVLGEIVGTYPNIQSEKATIDVSYLPNGIYYIMISNDADLTTTIKTIKL